MHPVLPYATKATGDRALIEAANKRWSGFFDVGTSYSSIGRVIGPKCSRGRLTPVLEHPAYIPFRNMPLAMAELTGPYGELASA